MCWVAAEGGRRYSDAQQLFLGNLPHCATEEELRALFGRFGPVAELRVHSKPAAPGAPRHPNYGFITYETSQAAHDCLNAAVSTPTYCYIITLVIIKTNTILQVKHFKY